MLTGPLSTAARARGGPIPVGLFVAFALTRVAASAIRYAFPDLELNYIATARAVFEGGTDHGLYFPISYPTLLYGVHALVGNWLLTTHLLYVVASTVSAVLTYLLVRSSYGESVARRAVLLALVIPNYTAAVVGYSHTPVVGYAFLLVLMFAFYRMTGDGDDWRWYVTAALAGTAAVLVRPETLLCFLALLVLWFWTRRHASVARTLGVAIAMCGFMVVSLAAVERVAWKMDPTEPFGLLGNPRYSYAAYIITLSMRASDGRVDTDTAIRLGEQAFGSGASNQYSIPRAISHNPRKAIGNLGYNAKSLLKDSGHPLFIPVFMLPLVGIGLMSQRHAGSRPLWLILASVVPATFASVMLTHVEVRYLMPLVLPLLVLVAVALEDLSADERRWIPIATYALCAAVSLTYLVYFHFLPGSVS